MTLEIRWSDKYENYVNGIFNLQLKNLKPINPASGNFKVI